MYIAHFAAVAAASRKAPCRCPLVLMALKARYSMIWSIALGLRLLIRSISLIILGAVTLQGYNSFAYWWKYHHLLPKRIEFNSLVKHPELNAPQYLNGKFSLNYIKKCTLKHAFAVRSLYNLSTALLKLLPDGAIARLALVLTGETWWCFMNLLLLLTQIIGFVNNSALREEGSNLGDRLLLI